MEDELRELERVIKRRPGHSRPLAAQRANLINDIVNGMSVRELARKYGVTTRGISKWKQTNRADIDAARGRYSDVMEMAALANRVNRVFELQDLYFDVRDKMDHRGETTVVKYGDDKFSELGTLAARLLHDIQVETGQQLPRATEHAMTATVNVIITRDGERKMAELDQPWKPDKIKAEIENVIEAEVVPEGEEDGED